MLHFFDLTDVGPDGGKKRCEFCGTTKPRQMTFDRVPLDAQNVAVLLFDATGEFVPKTVRRSIQRGGGRTIRCLEVLECSFARLCRWLVELVANVFDDHRRHSVAPLERPHIWKNDQRCRVSEGGENQLLSRPFMYVTGAIASSWGSRSSRHAKLIVT